MKCSQGKITFGHAKTGRVRTYMLVDKALWLEVSETRHSAHEAIVLHVAQNVSEANLSKEQAKAYLAEVLPKWPDI